MTQNTLVVGAGKMGNTYLDKLIKGGIAPQDITVVDIDSSKLDAVRRRHPEVKVAGEIPADAHFLQAIITSNSPAHLANLEQLAALQTPPSVLVEKPLFTTAQLAGVENRTAKLVNTFANSYVAYLIDFSPAVAKLLSFMEDRNLSVIQGKGNWEKNRTADNRPTAGDLEDEMTHQLATLMRLSRVNQSITNAAVSAKLTYLQYVDGNKQRALAEQDSSIPLRPNSATRLDVELSTDRQPVLLSMWSSFTSPEQSRVIQVELSTGGPAPEFAAQIIFDDPTVKGDVLKIWPYPKGESEIFAFPQVDKLGLQLEAFQRAVAAGERHNALHDLQSGLTMVQLAEAAWRSNGQRSMFVDVPVQM